MEWALKSREWSYELLFGGYLGDFQFGLVESWRQCIRRQARLLRGSLSRPPPFVLPAVGPRLRLPLALSYPVLKLPSLENLVDWL